MKSKKRKTPAGEEAEKLVAECPDVPTLRLARTLFTRFPDIYSSIEHARTRVRYYRGQIGDRARKKSTTKHLFRKAGSVKDGVDIFDLIPEPVQKLSDWESTPLKGNKLLVFGDTHIPFHDPEPIRAMLEYARKQEIDSILLNGDIIDFYSISRWEKDPRLRDLSKEVNDTIQFLSMLRKIWPDIPIVYKQGNHEDRYISYMAKRAPDLLGISAFDFDNVLCLEELKIHHVESRCYTTFGKLPIVHGHEFGHSFTSPVNPARGLWMKAKESALTSHHHRTSSHSERRMGGEEDSTFSIGCLCNLRPDYRPLNNWNHGFAIVERINDSGHFQISNKKIIGGEIFSG